MLNLFVILLPLTNILEGKLPKVEVDDLIVFQNFWGIFQIFSGHRQIKAGLCIPKNRGEFIFQFSKINVVSFQA